MDDTDRLARSDESRHLKEQEDRDVDGPDPDKVEPQQGDDPLRAGSRYIRGRRWWELSKWERSA